MAHDAAITTSCAKTTRNKSNTLIVLPYGKICLFVASQRFLVTLVFDFLSWNFMWIWWKSGHFFEIYKHRHSLVLVANIIHKIWTDFNYYAGLPYFTFLLLQHTKTPFKAFTHLNKTPVTNPQFLSPTFPRHTCTYTHTHVFGNQTGKHRHDDERTPNPIFQIRARTENNTKKVRAHHHHHRRC